MDDYFGVTPEKAAENGAALLDKRYPGWEAEIDLDILEMNSCDHCVLGQLYGGFEVGRQALDLYYQSNAPITYGFDGNIAWCDDLEQPWRDLIRERLINQE